MNFPTIGELAQRWAITPEALVTVIARLRSEGQLVGIYPAVPQECSLAHDVAPEDVATIAQAAGITLPDPRACVYETSEEHPHNEWASATVLYFERGTRPDGPLPAPTAADVAAALATALPGQTPSDGSREWDWELQPTPVSERADLYRVCVYNT